MLRSPRTFVLAFVIVASGCTLHHSRQALWADAMSTPSSDATFVTEEDSGLMLFNVFQVADADHYAVLLERMRRRHNCTRIHHAQLDFFTDYWILVAFPIARLTAVCEHEERGGRELVVINVDDDEDDDEPPEPDQPGPQEVNISTTGTLEQGDLAHPDDGSFYDEYTFTAGAAYRITVQMDSEAFDSYLHLRGPGNTDLQQNDDVEPGNLSARVVQTAPVTGQYTVLANSRSSGETGAYRLTITTSAP